VVYAEGDRENACADPQPIRRIEEFERWMRVHTDMGISVSLAPIVRSYMRRSGAPEDTGIRTALKDRLNALKNPLAHLRIEDIDFEKIASSPMLWDPIRYLESCPSSDGACAMVLAREELAEKAPTPPAWVHATAMRSEPNQFPGRDAVNPLAGQIAARDLYKMGGIRNPRQENGT